MISGGSSPCFDRAPDEGRESTLERKRPPAPSSAESKKKKMKCNPVALSSAAVHLKTAIKDPAAPSTGGSLPADFYDSAAGAAAEGPEQLLDKEYRKLKEEIDTMPFPGEDYGEDTCEDVEELVDRDDEITAGDIILAGRIENLKSIREKLRSVRKAGRAPRSTSSKSVQGKGETPLKAPFGLGGEMGPDGDVMLS